jgi:hypothetical protein
MSGAQNGTYYGPQSSYCGFGGAEHGRALVAMLPEGGLSVGTHLTLSTIPMLRQMQPGYRAPPRCGGACGTNNGTSNGTNNGTSNGSYGGRGKVSLGCSSCGGGANGPYNASGADAGFAVPKRNIVTPSSGTAAPSLSTVRHALHQHHQYQNQNQNQNQHQNHGSGPSNGPNSGPVTVVAYGKEWCGWSKKMQAAVAKARHPRIQYTTDQPAGCPPATAFPALFAKQGGQCRVLRMGFVDVSDAQAAQSLLRDAEKLFA